MKWIWFVFGLLVLMVAAIFVMPLDEHNALYKPVETFKEKVSPPKAIKILAVGDMLFDRTIRSKMDRLGGDHIFSCIDDLFMSADFVLGNLEGPITPYPSVSLGSEISSPNNFVFTMPPETAELLKTHNLTLVNLGNNHIGNFGREGLAMTHAYLEAAGVNYFGGLSGDEPVHVIENGLHDIVFISYNEFGGASVEDVAEKVRAEKLADNIVIVYTHWGEEYAEDVSSVEQQALVLASAGADLIIGSHPHVVLPSARLGDTIVYYSLGNFIFDQYWNERVSTGLVLSITLYDGTISVEEIPVTLGRDGRTCVK